MFCSSCDSLLVPRDGTMVCSVCGVSSPHSKITDTRKHHHHVRVVEDHAMQTNVKTKAYCDKCGNNEAYSWSLQTRSADEPETLFFQCTKCKHQWREY